MLKGFQPEKVFVVCGYTDLRRGIDGLSILIGSKYNLNPYCETLFLFCGRRNDRIKGLFWDGDGFILLYKRLEKGTFQWPRKIEEAKQITPQQYRWLMEGLKVDQPKAHRVIDTANMTVY